MPTESRDCFVIMPISDVEGYRPGHFKRVFDQIFQPACEKAGFKPIRADQVGETNVIQLDVLQRLLDSPMVLCDLSTRNPNVLFELGLRQAFDKPVALVREENTPPIFDIAPLRYTEYRSQLLYEEVLADQEKIAKGLISTWDACERNEGVNSLVRLLSLSQAASLVDIQEADRDPVLQIIRAELTELRSEFKDALRVRSGPVQVVKAPVESDYIRRNGLDNYLIDVYDIDQDDIYNEIITSNDLWDFLSNLITNVSLPAESREHILALVNEGQAHVSFRRLKGKTANSSSRFG